MIFWIVSNAFLGNESTHRSPLPYLPSVSKSPRSKDKRKAAREAPHSKTLSRLRGCSLPDYRSPEADFIMPVMIESATTVMITAMTTTIAG